MSNQKQRLFIALPVRSAPRLIAMADRLSQLGRTVRAVRPEQIHLTLKFLGDVAADRIDGVREAIDEVARQSSPFSWSVQGLGAFPTTARPRVVWAGCVPAEPVKALAGDIENGLASLGFERERGEFKPHLTLARVRGPAPDELRQMLQVPDTTVLVEERAKSIILYRSLLERGGAIHQPIREARLAGS